MMILRILFLLMVALICLPQVLQIQMFPFQYHNVYFDYLYEEGKYVFDYIAYDEQGTPTLLDTEHNYFYPIRNKKYPESFQVMLFSSTFDFKNRKIDKKKLSLKLKSLLIRHNELVEGGWRKQKINQLEYRAFKLVLNKSGEVVRKTEPEYTIKVRVN